MKAFGKWLCWAAFHEMRRVCVALQSWVLSSREGEQLSTQSCLPVCKWETVGLTGVMFKPLCHQEQSWIFLFFKSPFFKTFKTV